MQGFRLSVSLGAGLICTCMLLLAGCSTDPKDPTAGWSTSKIEMEAQDERSSGNFEKAITLFEKLEGRTVGTVTAQQAQLEKAFSQYKVGETAQAEATLDRFMKNHPASPALDYALYLKGLVTFNDNLGIFGSLAKQDLSERDQHAAKQSFESFRELVNRFPDSRYAPDARQRMVYIVNALAAHEVHVARYYYQRKAYLAAINRAQTAVTDYRNAPAHEEALFILAKSYEALGMDALRADAERVLTNNFPDSNYLKNGLRTDKGPWWKLW